MNTGSLKVRLSLVATLVLIGFLALTGLALDRAQTNASRAAERDQLQVLIYLLLGAADVDTKGGLTMPPAFAEARLSTPGSGLYAAVTDEQGSLIWQSESALGIDVPYPDLSAADSPRFDLLQASNNQQLHSLAYPVRWDLAEGEATAMVFHVALSTQGRENQNSGFRQTLWLWLGGLSVALLLVLLWVLWWAFRPLDRVAREVSEIEQGKRDCLSADHPRELLPLSQAINRLIIAGEGRLKRYRDALADLAHSLKTPLAVLAGQQDEAGSAQTIQEQVDRMNQAIAFHQQRGSTAGRSALATGTEIAPVVDRVATSLAKVYADRPVNFQRDIADTDRYPGDEGDLMEILGNLMDNAWKWAHGAVQVTAESGEAGLVLSIEDDGPGFPEQGADDLLNRGVRADQFKPGQGIGLAVVREVVESDYGGRIELGRSPLGGARVKLSF